MGVRRVQAGARGGVELSQLAASRVVALRQYMKYEAMRADSEAALVAGRWRLAALSARAAVGFALDVTRAMNGEPLRDEVRRQSVGRALFRRSRADRDKVLHLLTDAISETETGAFLQACWQFIDEVLALQELAIPGFFYGGAREDHEQRRREWLSLARRLHAHIPYSDEAVAQLLGPEGIVEP